MSSESIRTAIDNYLNASLSSTIEIAWEGIAYYPDLQKPFISNRMSALVRTAVGVGASAMNRWNGTYQLSIWYPVGGGMQPSLSQTDAVIALFKRGTSLATADGLTVVFETPTPSPAIQDQNWLHTPVMIPWFAYEGP